MPSKVRVRVGVCLFGQHGRRRRATALTGDEAVQHLETYWAILEKVRGSALRLTKMDDDIYAHLRRDFPDFDPAAPIDEDEMKSRRGKERWRDFMMAYDKKVDDYNFGTMLRTDPKAAYEEKTTIFGRPALPLRAVSGQTVLTVLSLPLPLTPSVQSRGCSSTLLRLQGASRGAPFCVAWATNADVRAGIGAA